MLLSSPLRLVKKSDNRYSINHLPFTSAGSENLVPESVAAWSALSVRSGTVIHTRMAPSRDSQSEKKIPSSSWNGSCLLQGIDTATRLVVLLSAISPSYVSWWQYSIRKVTDSWLDWMSTVDTTRYRGKKPIQYLLDEKKKLCPVLRTQCPCHRVLQHQLGKIK